MALVGARRLPTPPAPVLGAVAAGVAGLGAAGLLAQRGAPQTLGLLALPVIIIALLRSVWFSYAGVLTVVCLLPYAAPPLHAGVTPTLLELALLSSYALVGAVLLLDRRERLRTGGSLSLWLLLLGVTAFAFLLGAGRGYTTQTAHDYAKFVLAIGMFWLTLQLVRDVTDAGRLLRLLLAGITSAAALALALYAAGPSVTTRALTRLVPYGYPGSRIVRYIEDDPARPMRAIGTSVDPNSFGGLLMVGFVLAVGQLLARRRVVPVWAAGGACALCAAALLLTYSRGAWVGAFVGAGLIVVARRPRLIAPLGLLAVVGLALGAGGGFVHRLWLGFTLQDPATRLRLAEYRNASAIVRQHPWFGVGFGDAGSINLQAGVSSIYFTIAEQAGLLGLGAFLLVAGVVLWRAVFAVFRRGEPVCPPTVSPNRHVASSASVSERSSDTSHTRRTHRSASTRLASLPMTTPVLDDDAERPDLLLSLLAAFVACLTVGLVDHYFFNPRFPQMAALLWTLAGALAALTNPHLGRIHSHGAYT